MKDELLKYLKEADPKDLADCLIENIERDSARYFAMLVELYCDKAHFKMLSSGCKAAMLIYLNSDRGN